MRKVNAFLLFSIVTVSAVNAQMILGGAIYVDGASTFQEKTEDDTLISMGAAAHAFFVNRVLHGPIVGGGTSFVFNEPEMQISYRIGLPFELFETYGYRESMATGREYFEQSGGFVGIDSMIGYTIRPTIDSSVHLPWVAVGISRWDELFEVSAFAKLEQVDDTTYVGVHFRMGMNYFLQINEN